MRWFWGLQAVLAAALERLSRLGVHPGTGAACCARCARCCIRAVTPCLPACPGLAPPHPPRCHLHRRYLTGHTSGGIWFLFFFIQVRWPSGWQGGKPGSRAAHLLPGGARDTSPAPAHTARWAALAPPPAPQAVTLTPLPAHTCTCAAPQAPIIIAERLALYALRRRGVAAPLWARIAATWTLVLGTGAHLFFPPPIQSGIVGAVVASTRGGTAAVLDGLERLLGLRLVALG